VDEHVGLGQQRVQRLGSGRIAQVEIDEPLAGAGLEQPVGVLGHLRRIDAQHVGAEGGEEARGDRSGDDAREVEGAYAGGRLRGGGHLERPLLKFTRLRAHPLHERLRSDRPLHKRLPCDRPPLWVRGPGLWRTDGRRGTARLHDRGLQLLGLALGDRIDRLHLPHPERGQQRAPMVGVVGVRANPAVARRREPRERSEPKPLRARRRLDAAHVALGPERARDLLRIDHDRRPRRSARLGELRGGEQRRAHRSDGQAVDVEPRRQIAARRAHLDLVRSRRVAAQRRPQLRGHRHQILRARIAPGQSPTSNDPTRVNPSRSYCAGSAATPSQQSTRSCSTPRCRPTAMAWSISRAPTPRPRHAAAVSRTCT
jgi:hypothetical protein